MVGPFAITCKPGTVGRVRERAVVTWAAATAVLLLAVYLVTGSEGWQVLMLFASIGIWRWMQRRAAATDPLS